MLTKGAGRLRVVDDLEGGFRVQGLGLGVKDAEFKILGFGFGIQALCFRL